jgi:hypothetical protein
LSADLMDRLDAPEARRWEYEAEGDTLVGTVLNLGTFTGDYGSSPTVTVEAEEGSAENGESIEAGEAIIFYASPKIAQDELEAAAPNVGDRIGIRYHGERQPKRGENAYKVFKVAVERRDGLKEQLAAPAGDDGW